MSQQKDLSEEEPSANPTARPASLRAQWLYGLFAFCFAVIMALNIPFQTSYFDGLPFDKQPRTWPSMAIIGMVLAGVGHFWQLKKRTEADEFVPLKEDIGVLLGSLEYAIYFIFFVYAVQWIGFLPSALFLVVGLSWRLGYRDRKIYVGAVSSAFFIVLLFKGVLLVKIPGGWLYNFLPSSIESFAKTYF